VCPPCLLLHIPPSYGCQAASQSQGRLVVPTAILCGLFEQKKKQFYLFENIIVVCLLSVRYSL
jgi:hypothetical protein